MKGCEKMFEKNYDAPQFLTLKNTFASSPIGFALLNSHLTPFFCNKSLYDAFPSLKQDAAFAFIFRDVDEKTIKNYLKADGAYELVHNFPEKKNVKITINAIFDDEKFIGAAVFIPVNNDKVLFRSEDASLQVDNLNHEFHDRLNMMFSCIYALSRSNDIEFSEKASEYINNINQNCFQLLRVSDNLSRYLRLTEQNDHANFKLIDLCDFLNEFSSAVILKDNKNQVKIKCDFEKGPVLVSADIKRLEFALINILLNSIKYTREGNEILFSLKTVNKNAVITIADKGAGIPKEIIDKVGTPYFSYSHNGKFSEGFGVGIFIAKKYIASHGGNFVIQSRENEGTTVTISLPIDDGSEDDKTKFVFNSPPVYNFKTKFSISSVQLSEVCYYPEI